MQPKVTIRDSDGGGTSTEQYDEIHREDNWVRCLDEYGVTATVYPVHRVMKVEEY